MPSDTLTTEALARTDEYAIGGLEQIPRGEGRTFAVAGQRIAVFRTHKDEVFASQAECPHRGGPLADGMLGGTVIMCPLHDRSYDLRDGTATAGECGIAVHPVRVGGAGMLLVTVAG